MSDFNDIVGNGYLGGIHLNDSKAGLGEKKDLHENIGLYVYLYLKNLYLTRCTHYH